MSKTKEMTEEELYQALDNAGIEFEVVRVEEGLREIAVCVKEKEGDKTREIQEQFERDQNLRVEMFDSLIELMQEHRLKKEIVMWDSCSRLVYETWQVIAEEQDKYERGDNGSA